MLICLGGIFFQTRYYQYLLNPNRVMILSNIESRLFYLHEDSNSCPILPNNDTFNLVEKEIVYDPLKYQRVIARMAVNATYYFGRICQDWRLNKYKKHCDLSSSCEVENILRNTIPKYYNLHKDDPTLGYFLRSPETFDEMLDIYKKYFNAKGSCFNPEKEYVSNGTHQTAFIELKSMLLTQEEVLPKIVRKFDEFIVTITNCEFEDYEAELTTQQLFMTIVHKYFCYAANTENLVDYDHLLSPAFKTTFIYMFVRFFFLNPMIPFTIAFVIHTFFSIIWVTILGRCKKHFKRRLWTWKIIENCKIENRKDQKTSKEKTKIENKPKRGKKSSKYFVLKSYCDKS